MQPSDPSSSLRPGRLLMILAALVVLVAGLKSAERFFVPLVLAFFVATVSFPLTTWLRARKVPAMLAVLLTVVVDFLFIAAVIVLGMALIGELQQKWDLRYAGQLSEQIRQGSGSLAMQLEKWGVENAPEKIRLAVETNVANLQNVRFERILELGTGVLGHLVGFFGISLSVVIFTIFMLLEAKPFSRRFEAIHQARGPDLARMLDAARDIQRYLAIKTVVSLATGILAGLLCWAAGLDFYVLWGILAFALNFIPVVGSLVAGVPPTVLALLVSGFPAALLVAGGYLVINNFLGNFLEPSLVGRRLGVSTLVVVISVFFWGWVWGPLGMLLAVPITMVIKVILEGSEEFRWISVAISAEPPDPAMDAPNAGPEVPESAPRPPKPLEG